MAIDPAAAVQVWIASPQEVPDTQWAGLAGWLDDGERARAGRFKLQADRRSYVLAHALRRLVLAQQLALAPGAIRFAEAAGGKPVLDAPRRADWHFSHSRTRQLVVCAVTSLGPVGVDVEPVPHGPVDFDLLSRFIDLPPLQRREAEPGPELARRFACYWTALEAFWKAEGSGLATANPRIAVRKNPSGWFELGPQGAPPQARLLPVEPVPGCAIALALRYPQAHDLAAGAAAITVRKGNQLIHRNA